MPPVVRPFNEGFMNHIGWLTQMVNALARQQNLTFCDNQGRAVVNLGLAPLSNPPAFGLQAVNPSNGVQTMLLAGDDNGNAAMTFYASDGSTPLIRLNQSGLTGYASSGAALMTLNDSAMTFYASNGTTPLIEVNDTGLTQYDSGGHTRMQMGELPNGDYGLAYYSAANDGTYAELFPVESAYAQGTLTTTSSTETTIAGSPSVTATLGASGDALVTVSAFIGMSVAAESAVWLTIDGNSVGQWIAVSSGASGPVATNASSTRRLSNMGSAPGAGSHTFGLEFSSSSGTAQFSAIGLIVQPL